MDHRHQNLLQICCYDTAGTRNSDCLSGSNVLPLLSRCKMLLVQCRDAQGGLYEQLNYEAIKEQAGMDDSQLVYVSFSNEALAHLPYMVALDETSRWLQPSCHLFLSDD